MTGKYSEKMIRGLMDSLEIQVNGQNPEDVQIHNPSFYKRVAAQGTMGLGESYMDGWWDCQALDKLFTKILAARLDEKVTPMGLGRILYLLRSRLTNVQNRARSFIVGQRHYDIGNNLFSIMLDKGMNYSCAYWHGADNLEQAQLNKHDLICRKLGIQKGMRVLDIGCGWGGFSQYAAEHYGASVTGITVSKEQAAYAQERCKDLDVTIKLSDYRLLEKKYDRVVSVGMFEHVGWKNYRTLMKKAHDCLEEDGLFLLHTIGGNHSVKASDQWVSTYIFPNSMMPSAAQISKAMERLFMMEDWHNFGLYYDRTLMVWYDNFIKNYNKIKEQYNTRFFRMWVYYLMISAASFRARRNQLWQLVLSKSGLHTVFRTEGELFPTN